MVLVDTQLEVLHQVVVVEQPLLVELEAQVVELVVMVVLEHLILF